MATSRKTTTKTATAPAPARTSRGIQSVEVGGQLLKALALSGRPMALKDLARAAAMSPAKAHPYLVSFGKLGLVEQDALNGQYGLGPLAVQLGLISLQQVDHVRYANTELPLLAQAAGCTVSAAVWGPTGPVIVRVEEGPGPVNVSMRHGMPASLRHTGTGKIFAAHIEPALLNQVLVAQGIPNALSDAAFQRELVEVRKRGLSIVRDELIDGISAMAVPVFSGLGQLVLAIAAMGPTSTMDLAPDGALARLLRKTSVALSARLGYLQT